ncbi:acyltransferase family protein [Sphingomonas sp.]|uniref:acyltransferase family protein n=1 Tax=Sphingomonas sp. TaxID=28214 RepID=UPI0035C85E92
MAGHRIASIDALRGLAALCVLVQHGVQPIVGNPGTAPSVSAWLTGVTVNRFDLGRYGVILFFLISGYVVPFSLRGGHALRRFVVTRAARLYPAFWLSVAAMVLTAGSATTGAQVAANLTMAPSLLGQPPLSGVYWSLFVELVFYALCAALFAAGLLRRAGAVFALGLFCVALPLAGVWLRRCGIDVPIAYLGAHLSFLFAGTLMRIAAEYPDRATKGYVIVLTLAALSIMPILARQPDHAFTRSTPAGVLLAATAAATTFAVLHRSSVAMPAPLLRVGATSYSVYLFHIPVARVVARLVPPDGVAGAILYLGLTLSGTFAAAALVYARIEQPTIAWSKRRWPRRALELAVAP